MKTIIALAAGALLASVVTAQAADYYVPPPAPPVFAPVYDWTGFHIGVNKGLGAGRFEYPFFILGTPGTIEASASGWQAGGQIGYDFLLGSNFLAGVEADLQWSNIGTLLSATAAGLSVTASSTLDYYGTVRARAGVVIVERALLYATGGYAYGRSTSAVTADLGGGPITLATTNNRSGWTAGVGIEYALTPSISLKTEYLHLNLGTRTLASGGGAFLNETVKTNILRTGLNFRF